MYINSIQFSINEQAYSDLKLPYVFTFVTCKLVFNISSTIIEILISRYSILWTLLTEPFFCFFDTFFLITVDKVIGYYFVILQLYLLHWKNQGRNDQLKNFTFLILFLEVSSENLFSFLLFDQNTEAVNSCKKVCYSSSGGVGTSL